MLDNKQTKPYRAIQEELTPHFTDDREVCGYFVTRKFYCSMEVMCDARALIKNNGMRTAAQSVHSSNVYD